MASSTKNVPTEQRAYPTDVLPILVNLLKLSTIDMTLTTTPAKYLSKKKYARNEVRVENKRKMDGSIFEQSQNQIHMWARDIVSVKYFLSNLTISSVMMKFSLFSEI